MSLRLDWEAWSWTSALGEEVPVALAVISVGARPPCPGIQQLSLIGQPAFLGGLWRHLISSKQLLFHQGGLQLPPIFRLWTRWKFSGDFFPVMVWIMMWNDQVGRWSHSKIHMWVALGISSEDKVGRSREEFSLWEMSVISPTSNPYFWGVDQGNRQKSG